MLRWFFYSNIINKTNCSLHFDEKLEIGSLFVNPVEINQLFHLIRLNVKMVFLLKHSKQNKLFTSFRRKIGNRFVICQSSRNKPIFSLISFECANCSILLKQN